ncbi:MAG: TonB-dependent receptor [Terriglobia bacterium]|nr:TonB-dependent receptor [Terriglobia bacterium]
MALVVAPEAVLAQTSPIETITVTAKAAQNPALAAAPTSTPLDAIEPTSLISQDFIEHNLPETGNYDEAIKFSPSVFDTAPNGPGLAESQNITIRGFQDGQFNVTYDGIPWGDSNDFTHHTTSFFVSHALGGVGVDRGPGTAATIGNATFGGTVSILSKAPTDDSSFTPYVSYGSFNTLVYGGEINSGEIDSTGGTRILFNAEGLKSDGYLTNEKQDRQNLFLKIVQPLDSRTMLTLAASVNHVHQNIGLGATAAQIAAFGPNWGLSKDPTAQNYYGYNYDRITTDFEYADLASEFGDGWSLDMKVYTYAYFHRGFNGEDPNGEFTKGTCVGSAPATDPNCQFLDGSGTTVGTGAYRANDVPGQALQNDYRSIGTIFRMTKDFAFGDVKFGAWYDHQFNDRSLYEIDMTMGPENRVRNTNPNTGAFYGATSSNVGIDRLLTQNLQTFQPYLQVDWKPIENLILSPGVRYSYFDRSVNAQVNVKTGSPQVYDNTFDSVLPSISANYRIQPDWAIYGQIAKGFLAPNENYFDHSTPNTTNYAADTTWNYQLGTTAHLNNLVASADGYYIDFSNFITCTTVGGQPKCINNGGVTYEGLEAEATYFLGYGVSLYANGSLNSAKDQQTHQWIPNAPQTTGALGLIYNDRGIYGSLLGKWIGSRYGDSGQTQHLSPVFTVDASLGYEVEDTGTALDGTSLKLEIENLTDVTKIINLAGYTVGAGTPLYWTQPGRSAFFTISKRFQ